jgi:hypothetical protein
LDCQKTALHLSVLSLFHIEINEGYLFMKAGVVALIVGGLMLAKTRNFPSCLALAMISSRFEEDVAFGFGILLRPLKGGAGRSGEKEWPRRKSLGKQQTVGN